PGASGVSPPGWAAARTSAPPRARPNPPPIPRSGEADLSAKAGLDLELQPAPPRHRLAEEPVQAEGAVDVELEAAEVAHREVVLVDLVVVREVDRQLQAEEEVGGPDLGDVELDPGREGVDARAAHPRRRADVALDAQLELGEQLEHLAHAVVETD